MNTRDWLKEFCRLGCTNGRQFLHIMNPVERNERHRELRLLLEDWIEGAEKDASLGQLLWHGLYVIEKEFGPKFM